MFSSCLKPAFGANGNEKRGFEWSTFNLKLKCFYSKVGGYAPEYVVQLNLCFNHCRIEGLDNPDKAAPPSPVKKLDFLWYLVFAFCDNPADVVPLKIEK